MVRGILTIGRSRRSCLSALQTCAEALRSLFPQEPGGRVRVTSLGLASNQAVGVIPSGHELPCRTAPLYFLYAQALLHSDFPSFSSSPDPAPGLAMLFAVVPAARGS